MVFIHSLNIVSKKFKKPQKQIYHPYLAGDQICAVSLTGDPFCCEILSTLYETIVIENNNRIILAYF